MRTAGTQRVERLHGIGTIHASSPAPARSAPIRAEAHYFGVKSQTLASGTAKGPVTKDIEGTRYNDLFSLNLPSSLGRKLKAKNVVAMKVSVTGTATYPVTMAGGEEGIGGTTQTYTQKINEVGNDQVTLGQGKRFGCFEVGGLGIGYFKQGGTCPKRP